jgi:protein SCO1/2
LLASAARALHALPARGNPLRADDAAQAKTQTHRAPAGRQQRPGADRPRRKSGLRALAGAIGKRSATSSSSTARGRPVELSRYRGKPLLVTFIYTACFQVCPTTTRNLQKAVENTVSVMGADRFNVISIGFNQPFDSPAALKDFARQYGIRLPNWEFLSPAPAIVGDLTRNFGFSYVATPAGFDHLNQVTLVDADGRIVRQVYGEKFTAEDLAEPLKLLITGSAIPPEVGTLRRSWSVSGSSARSTIP